MSDGGDYTRTSREPIEGNYSTAGNDASYNNKHDPDEQVRADVCDRLIQFSPVDCTAIDVDVRDGVVRLRGTLASNDMRDRVLEAVRSVAGVRDIRDDLDLG